MERKNDIINTKWNQGWDLIDAFKPLESVKGWKKCKTCGKFPRVWEFNNGSFADCKCGQKYKDSGVRSESILSFITRNNGSALHYNGREQLRENWNKYIETGLKTELPKEQWQFKQTFL